MMAGWSLSRIQLQATRPGWLERTAVTSRDSCDENALFREAESSKACQLVEVIEQKRDMSNKEAVGVAFLGFGRMGETHLRNLGRDSRRKSCGRRRRASGEGRPRKVDVRRGVCDD